MAFAFIASDLQALFSTVATLGELLAEVGAERLNGFTDALASLSERVGKCRYPSRGLTREVPLSVPTVPRHPDKGGGRCQAD